MDTDIDIGKPIKGSNVAFEEIEDLAPLYRKLRAARIKWSMSPVAGSLEEADSRYGCTKSL